jgi:uncharacterized damage-inducible protein DinB
MKEFFDELYVYNRIMNEKVIHALQQAGARADTKAIQLMSHILLVHLSWNSRMQGKEGLSDFFSAIEVIHMQELNNDYNAASLNIVKEHDMDEVITYRNSKGKPYQNTFRDMLFHIINHSNYHRAQVNTLLRVNGMEPVVTDYVFYKREL